MMAGYALGASFAALLAQLGGGTFAKAADLGADLGGKESGLGEDDRENPAVVADLAGDIVGDCAGRGGGHLRVDRRGEPGRHARWARMVYRDSPRLESVLSLMLFPLVTRAFGVVAAMFGVMVVRTDDREDPAQRPGARALRDRGAPRGRLRGRGQVAAGRGVAALSRLRGAGHRRRAVGFLHVTQYYTEHRYRPVRELAEASRAGPTLTILLGLATGLEGAVVPMGGIVLAILAAFQIGARTGLAHGGLYGTAVATMGMLGPAAYLLAMDALRAHRRQRRGHRRDDGRRASGRTCAGARWCSTRSATPSRRSPRPGRRARRRWARCSWSRPSSTRSRLAAATAGAALPAGTPAAAVASAASAGAAPRPARGAPRRADGHPAGALGRGALHRRRGPVGAAGHGRGPPPAQGPAARRSSPTTRHASKWSPGRPSATCSPRPSWPRRRPPRRRSCLALRPGRG